MDSNLCALNRFTQAFEAMQVQDARWTPFPSFHLDWEGSTCLLTS